MNLKDVIFDNNVGFPVHKSEDWKYANILKLASYSYNDQFLKGSLTSDGKELLEKYRDDQSYNVVMIDGHYDSHLSDNDGIKIETVQFNKANINNSNNSSFKKKEDLTFFEELVNSKIENLLEINIYEKIDKPIHFIWINTLSLNNINIGLNVNIESKLKVDFRSLFVAEKETLNYFNNINICFSLNESSSLNYEEGFFDSKGFNVIETRIHQKKESETSIRQFSIGSDYTRSSVYIALEEKSSKCDLKGTYALSSKNMTDYFIFISHLARETKSSQLYKGLLNDNSTLIFNGEVYVGKEAYEAFSGQLNHNLALSDDAKVYSRPRLDIYCDDVDCSHGSALGHLGEEEYFYMQSRGISSKTAKRMLAMGFSMDVLSDYSDIFREWIIDYIKNKYLL